MLVATTKTSAVPRFRSSVIDRNPSNTIASVLVLLILTSVSQLTNTLSIFSAHRNSGMAAPDTYLLEQLVQFPVYLCLLNEIIIKVKIF